MRIYLSSFGMLIFAMVLAGCVATHRTGEDKRTRIYPSFTVNGNISIINSQKSQYQTIKLDGPDYTVDLIEIVNSAKKTIEDQIKSSESTNDGDQEKTIELSISNIYVTGIYKATIQVRVDLGNGTIRGVEAVGQGWVINTAINNATYNISDKVLYTAEILNYIEE